MAVYPCDWTGHRYPGPQRSLYFTVGHDTRVETHKLRLCSTHFRAALEATRTIAAEVDDSSVVSSTCVNCNADRELGAYVKVFDEHAEPVEYAADLCERCVRAFADDLHVSNGRALGAS